MEKIPNIQFCTQLAALDPRVLRPAQRKQDERSWPVGEKQKQKQVVVGLNLSSLQINYSNLVYIYYLFKFDLSLVVLVGHLVVEKDQANPS